MFDYLYTQRFQHTAARRRLHKSPLPPLHRHAVSTHSRPKAAANSLPQVAGLSLVSTHSRPKAAAVGHIFLSTASKCFNTQPPEGGCARKAQESAQVRVSTHSRPKAAAVQRVRAWASLWGFNTQPPEGGCLAGLINSSVQECFNTQPPEGGCLGFYRP